ncbi:MAG: DUF2461 domain-containing protein [Bacteroidales bacterium]|nr:DUF2461 domain-containing protein [Bacteroidales bacterium]
MKIQPIVFDFLSQFEQNNTRDWFSSHRSLYEESLSIISVFTNELIENIAKFDSHVLKETSKTSIFRIYRDIRFSPNKMPFKNHFGVYITKGGKSSKYAGYYLHLQNDASLLAGGLWSPEKEIVSQIRQEIYYNTENFLSIVHNKEFMSTFTVLGEEDKLKKAPKGYPSDFQHIDLLKHKHYTVGKPISNEEVLDPHFMEFCVDTFKKMYPLNNYLNTIIQYENNASDNY